MANYFCIMNRTGTRAWRVLPIQLELEKEGHHVIAMNLPQVASQEYEAILEWADVLTFQMVNAKGVVDRAKEKGIYTIFDCDDLIEVVPPKHPSYKMVQDKKFWRDFKALLKKVDLVTVSNNRLYERYKKYNKNIVVLPNFIPDYWERPDNRIENRKIRIGWAGGLSHQEDLDFIAPVVKKIIQKYPQVKFVYTGGGGWTSNNPDQVYRFGEDHFKDIPIDRREFSTGSRVETWPDKLNSMNLDIALAPLDENEFSKHKTHIKYFEYGLNHWAGVYQKFLYEDVVKHGKTGFLATTPAEWIKYIELLIGDRGLREEIGRNAYIDIKNHHSFSRNREQWLQVYRTTGENRTKPSNKGK